MSCAVIGARLYAARPTQFSGHRKHFADDNTGTIQLPRCPNLANGRPCTSPAAMYGVPRKVSTGGSSFGATATWPVPAVSLISKSLHRRQHIWWGSCAHSTRPAEQRRCTRASQSRIGTAASHENKTRRSKRITRAAQASVVLITQQLPAQLSAADFRGTAGTPQGTTSSAMELAPVHARYLVVLQCSVAQLHIAAGETGAAAAIWGRVLRSKTAAAHLPHHVAFEATSLRAPSRPKYARSPRTRSGAAVRRGNPDTGTKERDHLRRRGKPQCRQGGGGQAQPAMHLHLVTGHVRHKASRGGADAKISSFLGLSPLGLFSACAMCPLMPRQKRTLLSSLESNTRLTSFSWLSPPCSCSIHHRTLKTTRHVTTISVSVQCQHARRTAFTDTDS